MAERAAKRGGSGNPPHVRVSGPLRIYTYDIERLLAKMEVEVYWNGEWQKAEVSYQTRLPLVSP